MDYDIKNVWAVCLEVSIKRCYDMTSVKPKLREWLKNLLFENTKKYATTVSKKNLK